MEEMEGQDMTGIPVEVGDYNAPMDQQLAGNLQPDFSNQFVGCQEAINQIPMNYEGQYSPMPNNPQQDPVPINQQQYLPPAVNQEQYPPPAPPPNQQYAQPTPNHGFQVQYAQPQPQLQQFQNYAQPTPTQQLQYGPQKANPNHNYGQPNPNQHVHLQQYPHPKFNQQYAQTTPPAGTHPYPQPSMNHNYAYQQNAQSTPVNQAYPLMPPGQAAWSSQLFDCFDDLPLWLFTFFCPCVVFGQIAEIVDKGSSSCSTTGAIYGLILGMSGCQSIYSCSYRTKMRHQYGIAGDDMEDYCTHLWCESCALFQEYKHLSACGYDVPLGWYGQRQTQGVQMAPVAPNGMTR